MSNSILDLVRKNSNLVIDQQSKRPSMEESDVVINIDQLRDADGAPVVTDEIVENTMLDAEAARNVVDGMEPAISDAVNDAAALEANAALLKRARTEKGGIDQQAAAIVTTNIDNAVRRIGLAASAFAFPSVESFGGTATSYTSTERAETLARDLSAARRVVAVEQAIVQAEAIGNMNEDYVEVAEGLAARAGNLETVVANITGDAPDQQVELSGLSSQIGSKNGSVGTAAANLSNYITNALVNGAKQYNALGEAVAEVEATTADVPEVEATVPPVEAEADLTGTEEPVDVVEATVKAEAEVEPETANDADDVAVSVAVENVDKDTLVNENGVTTTKAKPDEDVATSDTPAEAAEGSPIATTLPNKPAMENDDPELSDIAEAYSTDADLPGDAEVDFIEPADAETMVGDEGDLDSAAAAINATDVGVTGGQHTGVSLPVLGQAEALLILKSVRDIAAAVVQHKEIVDARGTTLSGMHEQVTEVAGGTLDVETADAVNDAVDFNLAIYRKVSELERCIVAQALSNCRDLLTYVALSCKAYTAVPTVEESDVAPSIDPEVEQDLPQGE